MYVCACIQAELPRRQSFTFSLLSLCSYHSTCLAHSLSYPTHQIPASLIRPRSNPKFFTKPVLVTPARYEDWLSPHISYGPYSRYKVVGRFFITFQLLHFLVFTLYSLLCCERLENHYCALYWFSQNLMKCFAYSSRDAHPPSVPTWHSTLNCGCKKL